MYFVTVCNNSVVKPFIIADNNALSHLGKGILSYLCPLAGGIMFGGILSVSRGSEVHISKELCTFWKKHES